MVNELEAAMKTSNEEIERLNAAMKQTSDKWFYERYLSVRLRLEGQTFNEIGELLSRARQTVSIYWQAYQAQELPDLKIDHSPGQPTKLRKNKRHRLATMLEQHTPVDVDFDAHYTWTLLLVTEWI